MSPAEAHGRSDDAVREEAVAWLARLRSGPNPKDEAAFEEWYAADYPRHARIYDDLLDNWDRMALAAHTGTARDSDRAVARPGRRYWIATVAAVATLVALAGTESFRLSLLRASATSVSAASRIGEIRSVTLPDGSRVTLDTTSAIQAAYTRSGRHVTLLKGRARFDVAHDPDHPFVVEAGTNLVVAHGTVFDVALNKKGLAVSLLRGSVEVRTNVEGVPRSPPLVRMLLPGQTLSVEDHGAPSVLSPVTPDEARWPTGMRSFDNYRLEDVVRELNRYSATKIILADPTSAAERYTGTLSTRDPVGVAQMLAASYGLALSRNSQGALVLGPQAAAQK